jgi:hypothetical protein
LSALAFAKNSNCGRPPSRGIIQDQADQPVYLRIAEKAKRLREFGMSDRVIAQALAVSDETVANTAGVAQPRARGCPTRRDFS